MSPRGAVIVGNEAQGHLSLRAERAKVYIPINQLIFMPLQIARLHPGLLPVPVTPTACQRGISQIWGEFCLRLSHAFLFQLAGIGPSFKRWSSIFPVHAVVYTVILDLLLRATGAVPVNTSLPSESGIE